MRTLEGREESPPLAIIDAQSAKTAPDARGDVGFDAGKNVKGRKRHIVVDIPGMFLKADVHSAGMPDRDGAALSLYRITAHFPFIEKVLGDGAYAGPIAQSNSPGPREIVKCSDAATKVSSFCPNAGSLKERSHGSALTDGSQRILKNTPKPLWPSSKPP